MHNLSNEYFQNEFETAANEYGHELSPEFEFSNEYTGESAYELSPEFEFENSNLEMYEAELTQELMEVSNEFEFLNWLKNTAKKAAGVASNFLDSPTGKKTTAALTNIAQKTLPGAGAAGGGFLGGKAGGALGGAIGGLVGPEGVPIGQAIGGWAGGKAGSWTGGQAGQWAADRFPSFVRFATDTVRNIANEVSKGGAPQINNSIVKAAKKHYPIILKVKGTLHARRVRGNYNNEFEYNNEYSGETYGESAYEMEGEISHNEGTFNEVTEMELASELLSVQSEAELDRFLGKLFKKAVGAVKNFANSSTGKALGGMLKGLAKKALPLAGKALGTFIAPGIGTAIGGALGSAASNLFELELEGLSAEDREFETARAFVRFAGNSARRASRMGNQKPAGAARNSIINSARRYAPGLLARRRQTNIYNNYNDGYPVYDNGDDDSLLNGVVDSAQEGTWHREGSRIVLEANF
jgi:uncharacterized protein (DUF697 family)